MSLTQSKDAPNELFVIITVPQDEYEATQARLLSSLSSRPGPDHITVLDHDKILKHAVKLPLPPSPTHDYNLRPRRKLEASESDMSDASPSKRRKTAKGKAMKKPSSRKSLLAYLTPKSYQADARTGPLLQWPADKLPVEIFSLIISYLPRSSIQNLRLVNKEFDRKVVEALFKVVVVPFRPEIYGIAPESSANDKPQGSVTLQDKGMQVFQG